jgi:hypothetical protein
MKVIGLAFCLLINLPVLFFFAMLDGVLQISSGYFLNYMTYRSLSRSKDPKQKEALFNLWLLTFPVALGLTILMVILEFPIRARSWLPHGGQSGEINMLLMPYLHWMIWCGASSSFVGPSKAHEIARKNLPRPKNKPTTAHNAVDKNEQKS